MPRHRSPRTALPPGWPQVLRAIAEGPEWKVRPKDLAKRLDRLDFRGRILPTFAAQLDAMHSACWLYRFEELRREYLTLSGEAAERLGCSLEKLDGGNTRWVCAEGTTGGRWPRSTRREIAESDLWVGALNVIEDPYPAGAELAGEIEEAERALHELEAKAARGERITAHDVALIERVFPILLLVGSGTTWREKGMGRVRQGAAWSPPRECDTCKLLPLPRIAICLRCLRWGWDDFFAEKVRRRRA